MTDGEKVNRLMRSTGIVGGMTLVSRVLGFARDVLLAILFGAGAGMDAFLVAFKIPNFMRRLFAEGAFAQAFVPVLTQTREQGTQAEVRDLIAVVSGTLAGVLAVVTAIGVLAAPLFIFIFAPGFVGDAERFDPASAMLRLTFPYLFFIALTALAGAVLNTAGRFALPALAPALLNLSLIACAIGLAPRLDQPVLALAVGVLIAGVLQLALQLPSVHRMGLLPRPRWGWRDSRVRRILRLMVPILFGSSVAQIALLIDSILASLLVTGSVSWLYYADRLMEFPLGVFSIAMATVILPTLSRFHARGDAREFSATLDWALRLVVVICLPAAVGLFMLAGPMLTTLFQYSAFTQRDVVMAGYSLMAYAFGLFGFSLVKILTPAYFARQDTRTPVRYAMIALSISVSFNLILVSLALWGDWTAGHAFIALGTSLGSFLNTGLLLSGLIRSGVYRPDERWRSHAPRILFAVLVMAGVLHVLSGESQAWFAWSAGERALRLTGIIVAGAMSYFVALMLAGLRPREFARPSH